MTPRQAAEAASARLGRKPFALACADMLLGTTTDTALVEALGGAHARRVLDDGPRADQRYWLRVWAARGLLWVWDDAALPGILAALRDEHWRVREMAAKTVARHALGDALQDVSALGADPAERVRTAAARATRMIVAAGS